MFSKKDWGKLTKKGISCVIANGGSLHMIPALQENTFQCFRFSKKERETKIWYKTLKQKNETIFSYPVLALPSRSTNFVILSSTSANRSSDSTATVGL